MIILGLIVLLLILGLDTAQPIEAQPIYVVHRSRRPSGCLLIGMFILGIVAALLLLQLLSTST